MVVRHAFSYKIFPSLIKSFISYDEWDSLSGLADKIMGLSVIIFGLISISIYIHAWCHELLWEYGGYMISLVCTNYENSENYQILKISWDANAKTQINIPYVHANWFNMPKYMLGLD